MKNKLYKMGARLRRLWQPVGIGARAIVLRDDQILLVRLTYHPGWHLPGGGVEKGESAFDGMKRELQEECSLVVQTADVFGVYFNQYQGCNDHIMVYHVSETMGALDIDPNEIAEARFFNLNDLPATLSPGTGRRLQELKGERPVSSVW